MEYEAKCDEGKEWGDGGHSGMSLRAVNGKYRGGMVAFLGASVNGEGRLLAVEGFYVEGG